MQVTPIEPFIPDTNPFLQDAYHVGVQCGRRAMVMHGTIQDCDKYIIVLDQKTGQRIRIDFDE